MAKTLQQTALASASALRQAETDAQHLVIRLQDIGDTSGIQRVQTDLERLRASLLAAQTPLDVRTAKSGYLDTSAELRRSATAAEAQTASLRVLAREEEAASAATRNHQQALERLRASYDPLFAASSAHELALRDVRLLEDANMFSEQRAAIARENAAQSLLATSAATDRFAASTGVSGAAGQNLTYQFQDIAMMMAAGQSPFMLAMQQGTQFAGVLQTLDGKTKVMDVLKSGLIAMVSPVSLLSIGFVFLSSTTVQAATALGQFISGSSELKSVDDSLKDPESSLSKVSTTAGQTRNFDSLRDTYSSLTREVLDLVKAQGRKLRRTSRPRGTPFLARMRRAVGWIAFVVTRPTQRARRANFARS